MGDQGSSSSSGSSFPVPKFAGENYQIWTVKMKSYLKSFGLWEFVDEDKEIPPLRANPTIAQIKDHEEKKQKKDKAVTCLHLALSDDVFVTIMHLENAKMIWDELRERFEGSDRVKAVKLLTLKREFEMLKMKEGESIKEYSSKLSQLVNQMRLYGEVVNDSKVVEKMLISLPDRFESKVAAIEESCDLSKLTISEMISKLQAQEQRLLIRGEDGDDVAFFAKQKGKQQFQKEVKKLAVGNQKSGDSNGKNRIESSSTAKDKFPPCSTCKRTNHLSQDCRFKGKPKFQCHYCKKWGHTEKYCRLKQNQAHQNQPPQQANFSDSQDQSSQHLFMAAESSFQASKKTWYIDSGCTSHMARDVKLFASLDRSVKTKVKLGNGEIVQAAGKGTVSVQTSSGSKFIDDVLLIPDLDQNLLSVAQLMKKGYLISFSGKCCIIEDSYGVEIVKVEMLNDSFSLSLDEVKHAALVSKQDSSKLWHRRFGHFNLNSLRFLQSNDMVSDMPEICLNDDICDACQIGKLHRKPFASKIMTRAGSKLELVHTDLCGPMSINSLNQSRYFLLFIDDATRMTWVYFLSSKNETFEAFKKFKAMVELESGCKIKKLRSDNGGEYTSNQFNKFCGDIGIKHQLTVAYSPQQNGVSERKNRTVMEMARCLMAEKRLPKSFWAEAVHAAVYLLNRLPTKAVEEMTPHEAWTGRKPSVSHLKVFGSVCYSHIPAIKRTKLDEKAQVNILLGNAENVKGYRIFNLKTQKLEISRDVQVDEDAFWDWEAHKVQKNEEKESNDQHIQVAEDGEEESDSPVLKTKSLAEIYEKCNLVANEPSNYEDAVAHKEWRDAMKEEMTMIKKNKTWQLTCRPLDRKVIGVKWVFRTKLNPDGSVFKHKARLVVKGYSQQAGVDYGETFAPVARHDTVRLILALAAEYGWNVHHLDVKSAFLNGILEEDIFVDQPDGFVIAGEEDKVYKLHKALYGLKQAPRAWYGRIDSHFIQNGFRRSINEPTLYVKHGSNSRRLIISLYVDDLLVTGDDAHEAVKFKEAMLTTFEMTDLGLMRYFLGMEVCQHDGGIFISQMKYARDLLKKFKMESCKPVMTPLVANLKLSKLDGEEKTDQTYYRSLIGSLLYLTATRPDLMFPVSLLSRFMHSPSITHLGACKRVLRYLRGTHDFGIWYERKEGNLVGFVDSDWAGSIDDSKSTTGFVFSFGSGMFCWKSMKQEIVAQSTAEAEYVAAAAATNHAIWIRKILKDLGASIEEATVINCDNTSAIAVAKNPVNHGRTKHINVKYHSIREAVARNEIQLLHCSSKEQVADILTKALSFENFDYLRSKLGVLKKSFKEEC